ncbi:MAG: class I SAM-dependent methyltransferase [Clostridia bacterium]|nr:class I SAM-dependent methyltransferase [Clostridia bacterium]
MNYPKSEKYNTSEINKKIMGPNPLKLTEELLKDHRIPQGAVVMDLGSGQGVTSVFLAREYGFRVYAADLWSAPAENQRFFESMGFTGEQITAVKADAIALPFEHEFFAAVVCTDSYNFFGRDPQYLDDKLLPFVKSGGYIYICVPGMKKDCHDDLPPELLLSWTPEQLDYIHDADYWRDIVGRAQGAETVFLGEMESNDEAWADWLKSDNEYAVNDRKSMEAGAGRHMNFIAIVLRKK